MGFYDYKSKGYIYQYRDHLGNVRVSFVKNSAEVLQIMDSNDYYPFGMNFLKPNSGVFLFDPLASPYNYKYNGKELQETGMYDYGWRQYMPDIARWNGIDKLSEDYISHSPYAYVMNNPVMMFDPDGRSGNWWDNVWTAAGENGTTTYTNFNSDGKWGSQEFIPFAELGTATAFYNFLAGGGTGMYGYWSGTPTSSCNLPILSNTQK